MSSPETPKSQILISPRELHRIFEGLMSVKTKRELRTYLVYTLELTTVNDAVGIIKVRQTLKYGQSNLAHNIDINRTYFLVNPIQRSLIHKLHADADIRVRKECAVERDDILGSAVVHDLQFP